LNKTIIISPSGNLYGSENVLFDFLSTTGIIYSVYVKKNGLLYNKIASQTEHLVKSFDSEKKLYLKLIFLLFFNKTVKSVYVNEGGHIRYIQLLARIFKKRKFFIHIRIKEDTNKTRIGKPILNIRFICVSKYIETLMSPEYRSLQIYDPYELNGARPDSRQKASDTFKIGIIGRVTQTKGLDDLFPILDVLKRLTTARISFGFFGNYSDSDTWFLEFRKMLRNYCDQFDFHFWGFVENKPSIYGNLDLIVHLNQLEALGRIVFEALDNTIPILSFAEGGVGELMNSLKLNDLLIKKDLNWPRNFASLIADFVSDKQVSEQIMEAKRIIVENFNVQNYCKNLETLFNQ